MSQQQTLTSTEASKLFASMKWGLSAAVILLVVFFFFAQNLTTPWMKSLDISWSEAIRSMKADWLTSIAYLVTSLGKGSTEFGLFVIIAGLLVFKFKHAWEAFVMFLGVLIAWGLNELAKAIYQRERPVWEWLAEADGYSFPSGHAMVSTSYYGLIGYLLWINLRGKWKGAWSIPVLTVLLFVAIGFSRIYLGVHYPSDVLAGFAVGGAWLAGCIIGIHGVRHYKARRGML